MSVQVLNTSASILGKTLATLEGTQTFSGDKTFGTVVITGSLVVNGTINDQTLSSAASFTGTLTTADSIAARNSLSITVSSTASSAPLSLICGSGGGARTGTIRQHGSTSSPANDLEILSSGDIWLLPTGGDVRVTGTVIASGAITSPAFSSTLHLSAATAGTVVSSFVNGLNLAGFDTVGFNAAGTGAVFGGYRAAQWSSVGLYTSGSERVNISTAGVVKFNAYTAATFVAGDFYVVMDASGNIHRSAIGPAS